MLATPPHNDMENIQLSLYVDYSAIKSQFQHKYYLFLAL